MASDSRAAQALAKKLRALRGALLKRVPVKQIQRWAENDAIFQRTKPVTFQAMHVAGDPHLAFLRGAVDQDLLREIDVSEEKHHVKLHAWFLPPKDQWPTVIFSYGNASNLADAKYLMESFGRRGMGFLGWSYPGYEYSEGRSSERNVSDGLEAMSRYLAQQHGIQPAEQIAMGHSLGGLVTVDVATRIPFQLIVLIATTPSLPDYYEHLLSDIPSLLRSLCPPKERIDQRFDALTKISRIQSPAMLIYFNKDEEVPLSMAKKLVNRSATPNYELVLDAADHDAILDPRTAEEICNAVSVKARELVMPASHHRPETAQAGPALQ